MKNKLNSLIIASLSTFVLLFLGVGIFFSQLNPTAAYALELGDIDASQKANLVTEGPKAGGAIVVKEKIVQSQQPLFTLQAPTPAPALTRPRAVLTGVIPTGAVQTGAALERTASYRGIDGKLDITTMPGNSFERVRAQLSAQGSAKSVPVDGKPLNATTLADGTRVEQDFDAIIPAAGE